MRDEWYKASDKETLGGYKCIKNKSNKEELALVGKYGEIWEYSNTLYACVITRAGIANKYGKFKEKVKRGDESIIKFPKSDLDRWIKILGVKNNRSGMIKKANSF